MKWPTALLLAEKEKVIYLDYSEETIEEKVRIINELVEAVNDNK